MSKKQTYTIIISAVLVSLIANVFFGRWVAVKLSTLPVLNRFKILSPQAPIVITTREEVRVNDSVDTRQAVGAVRPKLSLVLVSNAGQPVVLGSAVNLTADGLFVTVKSAIAGQKIENLSIKLDDGTLGTVSAETPDPGTDLVILKTNLQNVPVANFAASEDVVPGQRIIFAAPTSLSFYPLFRASFVSQAQASNTGDLDADAPSRRFEAQEVTGLLPGQAVADASGAVLGVWDSNKIISSDVIKNTSNLYVNNKGQIIRPAYGFHYRVSSFAESEMSGTAEGMKVLAVTPNGPAQKAGMLVGDVITAWGRTDVKESTSLEKLLQNSKPGDKVTVKVARGKNIVSLELIVGELK